MHWLKLFFLVSTLFVEFCSSARIVAFFTVATKTHKLSAMPILEALADAGHQVTVISPFHTPKYRNVEEIVLAGAEPMILNNNIDWFEIQQQNQLTQLGTLLYSIREMFSNTYKELIHDERVQRIIKEKQADLVISDGFFNDMVFPIIDDMKVPFVFLCSMPHLLGLYRTIGTSNDYAFVPAGLTDSVGEMNFFERLANMISVEFFLAMQDFFINRMMEDLVRQDFPNSRPIKEIAKDVSLIITNSHPSFAFPRSLPPSVIPVSYTHTRPAQELSENFKSFVDEAKGGFIIFTLGSEIKLSSMPPETLQSFIRVFGKLKNMRIVWKWEGQVPDNLPPNVLTSAWLPQQDLLGHPNAKLYITHGGMASMLETIYHGVPVLGLPFGGDQRTNLAKAVHEGYALKLEWNVLDDTILYDSIMRLLNEPSFKGNATRLSNLVRDELMPGKDIAVYWIEHVLRHGGTKHLQLASKHMPLYKRYMLDIALFLILLSVISIFVTFAILKCLFVKIFRAKKVKTN